LKDNLKKEKNGKDLAEKYLNVVYYLKVIILKDKNKKEKNIIIEKLYLMVNIKIIWEVKELNIKMGILYLKENI